MIPHQIYRGKVCEIAQGSRQIEKKKVFIISNDQRKPKNIIKSLNGKLESYLSSRYFYPDEFV
ncbi:hypothetical protein DQM68_01460 [Leptospira mayottensis]|uniref:Uncharacterized protein n=2 Tax=Leptospira mayottensis TaxID=1137606 RepID=A0AA87MQ26_9LEPT|nr:hypothetical protein DQM68_01460 [Leptospira mayottensis]AZQ01104.1 hypothetical protein LEP1GSC190_02520 [Leptospira mayottensis 200901116]EKS00299.1 hypothetical protein LEP1GSC125_2939 [Leptospira mayottensis 200901122]AXR63360.1 hypothetical protein DQM28_03085 [Leptospira mayottensis]AXR67124.1 hypothetical protein DPV73_02985 [Leptospira mayottensis]